MKTKLQILAVVMVVALLAAFMLVSTGCSKSDTTTDGTTGTETETDTGEATENEGTVVGDAAAGEVEIAGACTECHDLTRILIQPDMPDWNAIITKMETAHGAVLTDQEKADIQAYLESRSISTGQTLVQGKCTNCHDLTNLYSQPPGTNWENVVATMVEAHGAQLTAEEQQQIADYLNSLNN